MKTIDVMEGDRFERESHRSFTGMYQYRNGQCRFIKDDEVSEWFEDQDTEDSLHMNSPLAIAHLIDWGYTLTPAAKPEAKPADVPEVDAVWVEGSFGDGKTFLTPHPTMSCANRVAANIRRANNGTARIVRIRSVDEDARADAKDNFKHVHDRINVLLHRIDALESRLAAEKPAARVVKLPKMPDWIKDDDRVWAGWNCCMIAVIQALASQGITVTDEGSKT